MKKEIKMNTGLSVKKYYLFQFVSGLHLIGAVLIPFFTDWGGVSIFVAQALQSWFTFCIFVLELPTGVVADLVGRKYSVALGALVTALGAWVYGSVPNVIVFAIGEFLFALGVALISGADSALLYDTLLASGDEKKSSDIFGKAKSVHMAGIAIGALAGGIVAKEFGLNMPMLVTSVMSLVAAAIAFSIPEPPRIADPKESRDFFSTLRSGFAPLRENDILKRWTINLTLVATAGYFVIWLYQPLMSKLAIPIEYFGPAQSFLVVSEMLVAFCFSRLVKKLGSVRNFANFTAFMTSAGFVLAVIKPGIPTLAVFLILSGGFGLTRDQLMLAEMNRFIKPANRATTLSSISMMLRISQAALNPIIGLITDRSVFISLILVGILPILAFFAPIKKKDTE